jgi:hypothetical protein
MITLQLIRLSRVKQVFAQPPFDFKVEAFSVGRNVTEGRFRNSAQGIAPGRTVSLA